MQSLNDDMDELFRRAADEYPLNTDGSDWNKLMQKLHQVKDELPETEKKQNDFNYLWFLLLLPLGFICGRDLGNKPIDLDRNTEKSAATSRVVSPPSDKTASAGDVESVPGKSTTPDKKIADVGRPGSQHGHSQVINSKAE